MDINFDLRRKIRALNPQLGQGFTSGGLKPRRTGATPCADNKSFSWFNYRWAGAS